MGLGGLMRSDGRTINCLHFTANVSQGLQVTIALVPAQADGHLSLLT